MAAQVGEVRIEEPTQLALHGIQFGGHGFRPGTGAQPPQGVQS